MEKEIDMGKQVQAGLEALVDAKQHAVDELEKSMADSNEQAKERETKLRLRLRAANERAISVPPKPQELMKLDVNEANVRQREGSI